MLTCSAAALATSGWWCLRPIDVPLPTIGAFKTTQTTTEEAANSSLVTLDTSGFAAQLWTPTPKVIAEESPVSPPPPPPELVLLAITLQDEQRIAAIFDKRQNRVFLAHIGDAVASVIIADITDAAVELVHGEQRSWLSLRRDQS